MATKTQKGAGLAKMQGQLRLQVGFRCWFTNPATGKNHEGIYRGKRTLEETTGFKRVEATTASGEQRTAAFEEEITTHTVPTSIVLHPGPKPVEVAK